MTLDEFFERLPRGGWRLVPWKGSKRAIRRWDDSHRHQCPITGAAGHMGVIYTRSARALKLPLKVAGRIAAAADGTGRDPALRARLLQQCGLTGAPTHDDGR